MNNAVSLGVVEMIESARRGEYKSWKTNDAAIFTTAKGGGMIGAEWYKPEAMGDDDEGGILLAYRGSGSVRVSKVVPFERASELPAVCLAVAQSAAQQAETKKSSANENVKSLADVNASDLKAAAAGLVRTWVDPSDRGVGDASTPTGREIAVDGPKEWVRAVEHTLASGATAWHIRSGGIEADDYWMVAPEIRSDWESRRVAAQKAEHASSVSAH